MRRQDPNKLDRENMAPASSSPNLHVSSTAGAGEMEGMMTFMQRLAAAREGMTQEERGNERLESLKKRLSAEKKKFAQMDDSIKDFFRGEHELRMRDLERDICKLGA